MNAVWVSRPRRRAIPLARALRRRGLSPAIRPAIRIVAAKNGNFNRLLASPRFYDLAVFVSEEAARRCRAAAADSPLPSLAVGGATLAAIESAPMCAAIRAPAGDGETLLRSPHLNARKIAGKKIAVVGGLSGDAPDSLSPRLCAELSRRGAEVFRAVAYRRIPAPPEDAEIARLCESGALRAAVAYSGGAAAQMPAMAAAYAARLKRLPLFVIHPNIAAAAQKAGYRNVHIAPPDAEEMAAAIAGHLQNR